MPSAPWHSSSLPAVCVFIYLAALGGCRIFHCVVWTLVRAVVGLVAPSLWGLGSPIRIEPVSPTWQVGVLTLDCQVSPLADFSTVYCLQLPSLAQEMAKVFSVHVPGPGPVC